VKRVRMDPNRVKTGYWYETSVDFLSLIFLLGAIFRSWQSGLHKKFNYDSLSSTVTSGRNLVRVYWTYSPCVGPCLLNLIIYKILMLSHMNVAGMI